MTELIYLRHNYLHMFVIRDTKQFLSSLRKTFIHHILKNNYCIGLFSDLTRLTQFRTMSVLHNPPVCGTLLGMKEDPEDLSSSLSVESWRSLTDSAVRIAIRGFSAVRMWLKRLGKSTSCDASSCFILCRSYRKVKLA